MSFVCGFLPIVLIGWWGLRRSRLRLVFLTLSSYVFYCWWDYRYLPLLIASTSVDYFAGRAINMYDDERRRKWILAWALGLNLSLLAYFKYVAFFLGSLNGIGHTLGLGTPLPVLRAVLPTRHLLLHVQLDVVHDRRLPAARGARPSSSLLRYCRVRLRYSRT